jgi:hypothetical protein
MKDDNNTLLSARGLGVFLVAWLVIYLIADCE